MNYNIQEKELFNFYSNLNLFPFPEEGHKYYINNLGIELIVRPECNQKCEYCYITQHGKDLYPKTLSKEETIKNVDLILDYVYNTKRNYPTDIEIFGGDLYTDDLIFEIFDLIIKYINNIKKEAPYVIKENHTVVILPSNLSWVYYYPEKTNKWRKYYHLFKNEYNITLCTSWSTDGLYCTQTREKQKLSEEYFDTIFKFCKEYYYGYHPMIAADNIANWIENYDWWMSKYKQYELTRPGGYFQPYLLVVRNDNWNKETTDLFCKFLEHLMARRLELCHNSYEELAYHLLVGDGKNNTLFKSREADPIVLDDLNDYAELEGILCGSQHKIHFNCTNLSIVFCHRMTYPQFTPIYFELNEEKNKIIDFKPQNIESFITMRLTKVFNYPICSKCELNSCCLKGCLGSQFESTGEPFMVIPSLCEFFKTSKEFLVDLYQKYHVIEYAKKHNLFRRHEYLYNKAKEKGYLND